MRTHPAPLPAVDDEPSSGIVMPRLRALGFRFLHVIDAVTLFVVMHLITTARFGFDWPTFPYSHYAVGFGLATLIHIVVYYFGGMYEYEQRLGRPPWLPRAIALSGVAILVSAASALVTGRYLMPRGNLVMLFFVAAALVSLNRWLARRVRSRRFGAPRVLLVGAPDDIELARDHLNDSGSDATIAGSAPHARSLLAEVDRVDATDVLLLSGEPLSEIYPTPLDHLERRLIGVYRRVMPVDTLLGLQRSREIAGMPFVALRTHAVPLYRLRLKRTFDLLVITLVAPVALLVMGLAATYARVVAGPGIVFRQERVGRRGQTFTVFKFGPWFATLSSTPDPPSQLTTIRVSSTACDGSVSPASMNCPNSGMSHGATCRSLALALSGRHSSSGSSRSCWLQPASRHSAGNHRFGADRGRYQTDPAFKLGHDLQYIVNWSLVLDLLILAETVAVVIRRSER